MNPQKDFPTVASLDIATHFRKRKAHNYVITVIGVHHQNYRTLQRLLLKCGFVLASVPVH